MFVLNSCELQYASLDPSEIELNSLGHLDDVHDVVRDALRDGHDGRQDVHDVPYRPKPNHTQIIAKFIKVRV